MSAAQHVCATGGYGPPGTNAEAMLLLARHVILASELGASMAAAVRFRNLLVHGYADVDDSRVVAALQMLADIDACVAALTALV